MSDIQDLRVLALDVVGAWAGRPEPAWLLSESLACALCSFQLPESQAVQGSCQTSALEFCSDKGGLLD